MLVQIITSSLSRGATTLIFGWQRLVHFFEELAEVRQKRRRRRLRRSDELREDWARAVGSGGGAAEQDEKR
jgi:hypothetical protein